MFGNFVCNNLGFNSIITRHTFFQKELFWIYDISFSFGGHYTNKTYNINLYAILQMKTKIKAIPSCSFIYSSCN
jgi:hypothetical protein